MSKELTPIEKALHRKKVAMGECVTQAIHHLDLVQECLLDSVMYSDKEHVPTVEDFRSQISLIQSNMQLAFGTSLTAYKEQGENMPYGRSGNVSYL